MSVSVPSTPEQFSMHNPWCKRGRENGDRRRETGNPENENGKGRYENTIGKTSFNLLMGLNLRSHGWNPWTTGGYATQPQRGLI
jgi:hypothetical protein